MQCLVSASARGTRPAAIVAAFAGSSRRAISMPSLPSSSIALRLSKPVSSPPPGKGSSSARWTASRASSSPVGGGGNIGGGGGGGGGSGGGAGGGGSSGGTGGGGFLSFLSGLWPAYLSLLASSPLATKSATAAVLTAAGDASAQLLIERKELGEVDRSRLARFTLLGGILVGPALHWWYGALARVVTLSGTPGALARLALDQLAFAPVFIGSLFAALGFLEGKTGAQVEQKLRDDLPATVRSNWVLWVPANFFNFRFVPVPLQVGFSNFVALFWNTYLSFVSNRVR